MRIIEGFDRVPAGFPECPVAVSIGNFDGCHIGHQALIREATKNAREIDGMSCVQTFDIHPRAFLGSTAHESLLFSQAQKIRALGELGVDLVLIQTFGKDFMTTSPADYVRVCLGERLGARAVVVGTDFRFGHGRAGDVAFLTDVGRKLGMRVTGLEPVAADGEVVSSSRIRNLIRNKGDMRLVAALLGRPYAVEGVIVRGDQMGRRLGVPTANLGESWQVLPSFGVYAGRVVLNKGTDDVPPLMSVPPRAIPAVFSVGIRPSIHEHATPDVRVEAHLLEGTWGEDSLYGYRAIYYFEARLREERRYPDLESLKRQMREDIREAKHILRR
jgi:riboflavin kinase/FMN adenylyltransferase